MQRLIRSFAVAAHILDNLDGDWVLRMNVCTACSDALQLFPTMQSKAVQNVTSVARILKHSAQEYLGMLMTCTWKGGRGPKSKTKGNQVNAAATHLLTVITQNRENQF